MRQFNAARYIVSDGLLVLWCLEGTGGTEDFGIGNHFVTYQCDR